MLKFPFLPQYLVFVGSMKKCIEPCYGAIGLPNPPTTPEYILTDHQTGIDVGGVRRRNVIRQYFLCILFYHKAFLFLEAQSSNRSSVQSWHTHLLLGPVTMIVLQHVADIYSGFSDAHDDVPYNPIPIYETC